MGIETETGHMIGVETNRTISLAKSIRRKTRVVAPANNFPQGPFSLVAKLPPPEEASRQIPTRASIRARDGTRDGILKATCETGDAAAVGFTTGSVAPVLASVRARGFSSSVLSPPLSLSAISPRPDGPVAVGRHSR